MRLKAAVADEIVAGSLGRYRLGHATDGEHTVAVGQAYLSGLIIGQELQSMITKPACTIGIVGSHTLAQHYQQALSYCGFDAICIDSEAATILGALAIMQRLPN